jgi:hypothetical protein
MAVAAVATTLPSSAVIAVDVDIVYGGGSSGGSSWRGSGVGVVAVSVPSCFASSL